MSDNLAFRDFVPLDAISIANPCPADWNKMKGNDEVRFCATCEKNVYNLSGMSRSEAEALILATEGNLCGRFYRRADGTIITDNCPVGLRPVRNGTVFVLRAVAATIAACITLNVVATARGGASNGNSGGVPIYPSPLSDLRNIQPFRALQNVQPFAALIDAVSPPDAIAGAIFIPLPPSPAPTPIPTPKEDEPSASQEVK